MQMCTQDHTYTDEVSLPEHLAHVELILCCAAALRVVLCVGCVCRERGRERERRGASV